MTVEAKCDERAGRSVVDLGGAAAEHDLLVYLYSRPGLLLSRVDQITEALFANAPSAQAITLLQMQVLAIAVRLSPLDQAGLSAKAVLDASTLSLVVSNLLKAGLVERTTPAEDRRRKIITPTQLGIETLALAREDVTRQDGLLLNSGAISQARMVALLHRLIGGALGENAPLPPTPQLRAMWESTSFLCRRSLQLHEAIFAQEMAAFDLTVRQYVSLLVVFAHPGVSQAGVARIVGFGGTTAALVLGILTRKGLITEGRDDSDKRRKRYEVTAAGTDLLKASSPTMFGAEATFLAPLAPDERRELERALSRMTLVHNDLLAFPLAGLAEAIADPRWPLPVEALGDGQISVRVE